MYVYTYIGSLFCLRGPLFGKSPCGDVDKPSNLPRSRENCQEWVKNRHSELENHHFNR